MVLAKKEPLQRKDYLKILAIAGIVIVPPLVGIYAVQLEEKRMQEVEISCEKAIELLNSPDFREMIETQRQKIAQKANSCDQ